MTSPPPVAPKLLRRSSTDRVLGGVCGGLGKYWNVDPVVLRVAFGVSLLLGGFGLFAYLAMWLLVPDETAAPTVRVSESWGLRILGSITAFIAAMIGLGLLFSDSLGGGGVLLGALLAGIVVWIVMSQRADRPGQPAAMAPPAPVEQGYAYGGDGGYTSTEVLPQPPLPPVPPRERSYLGLIGLCAAVAAGGVAMLFSDSPTVVLAWSLLALGVTLLVGALVGRAKWLLIFAVPLLMMLAVVSQVERADITTGEVRWTPTAQDTSYSLTAGTIEVDFSQWQSPPRPGDSVSVNMGLGRVDIAAPRNWNIELVADIGAGEIRVDGESVTDNAVTGRKRVSVPASSGEAEGTLVMNVSVRAGEVVVETGAPAVGEPAEPPVVKKKQEEPKKEKVA